MKIRDRIQDGQGRGFFSITLPVLIFFLLIFIWPSDKEIQQKIFDGLKNISFVAAAFAVTAYNLRTRVVDFVIKVEAKPTRVEEFCRIARDCGKKLTNLVILFTLTAAFLGTCSILIKGSFSGKILSLVGIGLFISSLSSFIYIIFSFERLERFVLDSAEKAARQKEVERLLRD